MSVPSTAVEFSTTGVVVNTPIVYGLYTYDLSWIKVRYGSLKQDAVYGVDYTVEWDDPLDPSYTSVTVTPLASLLAKIAVNGTNVIYVRRELPLTSAFDATNAAKRADVVEHFDKTLWQIQQVDFKVTDLVAYVTIVQDAAASAILAANSATAAAASETAAAASEAAAATSETNAAASATAAAASATAAALSATAASDSETAAAASEAAAAASATAAAGSATAAATSATNAATSASAAATSATNAATSETNAAASATAAAASQAAAEAAAAAIVWECQPIGVPIPVFTNITGVSEPPTDQSYRYVKLTAGLTGSGQYNNGILTSESVSGSSPDITATATVSLAGSPINGQSIRLINSERRILKGGSAGTVEGDAIRNITGQFSIRSSSSGQAIVESVSGAFARTDGSAIASAGVAGAAATFRRVDLDASTTVPTATENRPRNIGVDYYMRIK